MAFLFMIDSDLRLWRKVNRAKPKLPSYNKRLELKSKYFWNKMIKSSIREWQWKKNYHFFLIKSSNLTVIILQKWLCYASICLLFYRWFGLESHLKSSLKSPQLQIQIQILYNWTEFLTKKELRNIGILFKFPQIYDKA